MKIVKYIITTFFLILSYFVTLLIFTKFLNGSTITVDNLNEDILLKLITGTLLSCVGIFFLGLLSIFTNFVFVKLIYNDEIREAAYILIREKRTLINDNKDTIIDETVKKNNSIFNYFKNK
jgi:hypothetical protein